VSAAVTASNLRHLAGLPEDVPVLETIGFKMTQHVAADAVSDGEIAAFTGRAGLGKTFAVDHAARHSDLPWVWAQIGPSPRPKEVTARLLKAIFGSFQDGTLYELTDLLVEELASDPRIVVIDDAQNLDKDGLDQIRLLHDLGASGFPLFLVGGEGCADKLASDPQLADRVGGWVKFKPIPSDQIVSLLSEYHPFFEATDPELLAKLDSAYAKGVLRRWARLLKSTLRLAAKTKTPDRITLPVVQGALAYLEREANHS
jgi:hypothetical protein